jgi:hypothetical protein
MSRILGIGWRQHDDTDADFDATVDEIVQLRAEVQRLRSLVWEAYREGFATSDEMGWHGDDSASETRWLASAARAALEVAP